MCGLFTSWNHRFAKRLNGDLDHDLSYCPPETAGMGAGAQMRVEIFCTYGTGRRRSSRRCARSVRKFTGDRAHGEGGGSSR